MKHTPFLVFSILLFAACTPAGGGNQASLSEAQIRQIVQEEVANSMPEMPPATDNAGDSSDTMAPAAGLSDEEFFARVEKGIEQYVAKQEEEARKAQEEASKPQLVENVSVDDDPVLGDPNAPVTIVEFSDFECPFCSRSFQQVFPKIKEKYIDTGKVKYVFRDFPLDFHPEAIPAAVAANCARAQGGDKVYFEYHEKLFLDQQNLNEDAYKAHAAELNLNESQFASCIAANDTAEIENDMKDGQSYGVSGTPGFFINGWSLKGAYPYEAFEELIEQELAKTS